MSGAVETQVASSADDQKANKPNGSSAASASASASAAKISSNLIQAQPAQAISNAQACTLESIAKWSIKAEDDGSEFGLVGVSRYKAGGLQFIDATELAAQKGVLKDLVTQFGATLLQGKSPINISLPVRIFEPRSFLQRIPDAWSYAPIYLSKAALSKDPVERVRLVMSFFVSGLHRCTQQRKPFNPILGETYQAHFLDGSEIYLEQISHHPPISAFQVLGPSRSWQLSGYHDFKASFRPNGIGGGQYGPNHVDFPDGTRITFNMPSVNLSGIMWGDRVCEWSGTSTFEDTKNNLKGEIHFNPDRQTGLMSYVWGSTQETPTDFIRGSIFREKKNADGSIDKVVSSKLEGSWLDGLSFDGKKYWTRMQYKPFQPIPVPVEEALPSDCQFREDLIALKTNATLAQTYKTQLEEKQRYDNKLRKQAATLQGNHH
jgi:hypothetical protein